ncbi:hypothetical protein [Catenuloplanes indicus]|uniref:Uncharacterized protein n=1 Tax=Catenuloplanes indicus TaxID=137267 RepID=A0AAE3VUP9_9ACTN|nr:hypothetical protein [Catenuloplanes indicus]MDQ0363400.1 hypothetical protein [Catenuloplanes indicus]
MIDREYHIYQHQCTSCATPCDPARSWRWDVISTSTETGNETDLMMPGMYATEAAAQAAADAYEENQVRMDRKALGLPYEEPV